MASNLLRLKPFHKFIMRTGLYLSKKLVGFFFFFFLPIKT